MEIKSRQNLIFFVFLHWIHFYLGFRIEFASFSVYPGKTKVACRDRDQVYFEERIGNIIRANYSGTTSLRTMDIQVIILLQSHKLTQQPGNTAEKRALSSEESSRLRKAYLLTSQTLHVLSMEHEARKSPQECHEHPHTAWVWSVKVRTHSAFEKSQIFTVPSPDEVAKRAPLLNAQRFVNKGWVIIDFFSFLGSWNFL